MRPWLALIAFALLFRVAPASASEPWRLANCYMDQSVLRSVVPIDSKRSFTLRGGRLGSQVFSVFGRTPAGALVGGVEGRIFRANQGAFFHVTSAPASRPGTGAVPECVVVLPMPAEVLRPRFGGLIGRAEAHGALRVELDIQSGYSPSQDQNLRFYFQSRSEAQKFIEESSFKPGRNAQVIPITEFSGPRFRPNVPAPDEMRRAKSFFANPNADHGSPEALRAEQTLLRSVAAESVARVRDAIRSDNRLARGDAGSDWLSPTCLAGFCGLAQADTLHRIEGFARGASEKPVKTYSLNARDLFHDEQDHRFLAVVFPSGRRYLVDVTFRQFFETNGSDFHPVGDALRNQSGGQQLANTLLSNGWVELTDDVANLYGRAFLASGTGTQQGLRSYRADDFTREPPGPPLETWAEWRHGIQQEQDRLRGRSRGL